MFKKFIVCDCFLEIACSCLNKNADFGQFKGMCLKHFDKKNGSNSVFAIMNASEHIVQRSLFNVTYIACCKDFVDFQIELFIKTDSFELISIDCDWTREYQIQVDRDDDFAYRENMYLNDSDDLFDSSDGDKNVKLVKDCVFSSSLCFTQMRTLRMFCIHCQDVLLMNFVSKLHTLSNDVFSFSS